MLRTTVFRRTLASLREKATKREPLQLYEPIFVDPRLYPEYSLVNVRLQGYDFVPLERYQKFVHRQALRFNFKVVDSYAAAAQTERVVMYKPNSQVMDADLNLSTYDRVVRLGDVPSVRLPLFVSLITAHLPSGVKLTVKKHEKADEDMRYIPDLLLKQKQDELKSLDDISVRKNLGWE